MLKRILKLPFILARALAITSLQFGTYLSDGGTIGHAALGKLVVVKAHIWHHDGPFVRTSLFGTSLVTIKLGYANAKVRRSLVFARITHNEASDRFANTKTCPRPGNYSSYTPICKIIRHASGRGVGSA